MDQREKVLIGALIGLARATEGNEHLITPQTTELIRECLNICPDSWDSLDHWLGKVEEEKRNIVPNCFYCACPCGRTSAYDLAEMEKEPEDVRHVKLRILREIREYAKQQDFPSHVLYRGLILVGIVGYDPEVMYDTFLGK